MFFRCAFRGRAEQSVGYMCQSELYSPLTNHFMNTNFRIPSSETRFWRHLKDVIHMQLEIALGIDFTHSIVGFMVKAMLRAEQPFTHCS